MAAPKRAKPHSPAPTVASVGGAQDAQDLATLPNLGPKSRDMLAAVQIHTLAQLRALGAVAAYVRVKQYQGRASLNLLWALEGALTGLPWQAVARAHRTSLLLALDQSLTQPPHASAADRRVPYAVRPQKRAQRKTRSRESEGC